jgi:hypothetical protein
MEWVLQVLDEFDDVGAVLAHWWLGARRAIALVMGGLAGAAVLVAAFIVGADTLALAGAVLGIGAALSLRRRLEHTLP